MRSALHLVTVIFILTTLNSCCFQWRNLISTYIWIGAVPFFLGECRGTRTPKHFVNLMGESKNFKMLKFPLNQLQTYYGYLCDLFPLTAFIFLIWTIKWLFSWVKLRVPLNIFLEKKALNRSQEFWHYSSATKFSILSQL
jgi:hypothetical protein